MNLWTLNKQCIKSCFIIESTHLRTWHTDMHKGCSENIIFWSWSRKNPNFDILKQALAIWDLTNTEPHSKGSQDQNRILSNPKNERSLFYCVLGCDECPRDPWRWDRDRRHQDHGLRHAGDLCSGVRMENIERGLSGAISGMLYIKTATEVRPLLMMVFYLSHRLSFTVPWLS